MVLTNARVVTIITAFDARARLLKAFSDLGVQSFSSFHVEGMGTHGEKRTGLAEAKNIVYVSVVSEALASRVLAWVEADLLPSFPSIAFTTDAVAVAAVPIK
jgi:hypothetical protein